MIYDSIIIGGGPAGLTAATYGRRAGKSVLVIEKNAFGGQITWSPKVENFPGFLSISGTELGDKLMEQAMEQGAEVELELLFPEAQIQKFLDRLTDMTSGMVEGMELGQEYRAFPV